jgi:DNA-binding response OmpR family regulator
MIFSDIGGHMTREKILIIEDDEDIQELVTNTLVKNGYQVTSSLDGEEYVRLIKSELPDLIILDLMLPKLDGFDVCRNLKRDPDTRDIPIIMLTCKGEYEDISTGFEIGADEYITKPFSPKLLLARIKVILSIKNSELLGIVNCIKSSEKFVESTKKELPCDNTLLERLQQTACIMENRVYNLMRKKIWREKKFL